MQRAGMFGLVALFGLLLSIKTATAQFVDPVDWAFSWTQIDEDTYELTFQSKVDAGWHVYSQYTDPSGPIPTSFNFDDNADITLEGKVKESGKIHRGMDESFGVEVAYFEGSPTFRQRVKFSGEATEITGYVEYMVCDDSRCLPPTPEDFSFALKASAKAEAVEPASDPVKTEPNEPDNTAAKQDPQPEAPQASTPEADKEEVETIAEAPTKTEEIPAETSEKPVIGHIDPAEAAASGLVLTSVNLDNPVASCSTEENVAGSSLWKIFFLGMLGGFVALLTPCVFPMIPLTVSFFTKGSEKGGIGKAFLYGFSIFLIYTVISIPFHLSEGVSATIFNEISTNVWLNLAFFVIFVVFAISFFGYFEITLPSGFTNKVSSASTVGGLLGIFMMALVLALVSFSCTGPILGTLLVEAISSNGGAMQLTAGLAGFGLALGLPFGLLAASPKLMNSIPRSGAWMNTTKVVLGFVELGLALKFLSKADLVAQWGILKREIFFAIWILIGIALVLYLLGIIRFSHDQPLKLKNIKPTRWALALGIAAFVVYLIPGLTNTPAANRTAVSGFPPPLFYSIYEKENECPLGIDCFKDYEKGLAYAQEQGKPVMIDFTGWGCENCRKMEENVWEKEEIYSYLSEDYVLISLYVDDRDALPQDEQLTVDTPTGKRRKLRTVGNKWAVFQENFGANSQPYYVLMSPDQKLLNHPVGYTPNVSEFREFLECGLNAYEQLTSR